MLFKFYSNGSKTYPLHSECPCTLVYSDTLAQSTPPHTVPRSCTDDLHTHPGHWFEGTTSGPRRPWGWFGPAARCRWQLRSACSRQSRGSTPGLGAPKWLPWWPLHQSAGSGCWNWHSWEWRNKSMIKSIFTIVWLYDWLNHLVFLNFIFHKKQIYNFMTILFFLKPSSFLEFDLIMKFSCISSII